MKLLIGGLFAISLISILQLKPGGQGTFILTSVNGVLSWAPPPTIPPSQTINFADAEVPAGTIDGNNGNFTLAHIPLESGASLILSRNGIIQKSGIGGDFLFATPNNIATITFQSGSIPQPGDILQAWYRY